MSNFISRIRIQRISDELDAMLNAIVAESGAGDSDDDGVSNGCESGAVMGLIVDEVIKSLSLPMQSRGMSTLRALPGLFFLSRKLDFCDLFVAPNIRILIYSCSYK